jgi:hypothetical protein
MNTYELVKLALLRAKIELECVDDPTVVGRHVPRSLVRKSTLQTINAALKALDKKVEVQS